MKTTFKNVATGHVYESLDDAPEDEFKSLVPVSGDGSKLEDLGSSGNLERLFEWTISQTHPDLDDGCEW